MKKWVGYAVSGVGLAIMILGIGGFEIGISFLEGIGENIILGIGVAIVIAGVGLSMVGKGGSKSKHSNEEVPIYEGTGKNRKIVGYRRD